MRESEKYGEIDLYDILKIIWQRRYFLFLVIIGAIVVSILIAYLLPQKYRIGLLARPGITAYSKSGEPIYGWSSTDVAKWFKSGAYFELWNQKYKGEISPLTIEVRNRRDSKIFDLVTYYRSPEDGKELLLQAVELFLQYTEGDKKSLDKSLLMDIKNIESEGKTHNRVVSPGYRELENTYRLLKKQLSSIAGKIKTINSRIVDTRKSIQDLLCFKKDILNNTEKLVILRDNMVKNRDHPDPLTTLMYTNLIQQNLDYVSSIEYRINNLRKDIADDQNKIKDLSVAMVNLQGRIQGLTVLEILGRPYSSVKPAKPNKTLIILVGCCFGVFLGVTVVFVREILQKIQENQSNV